MAFAIKDVGQAAKDQEKKNVVVESIRTDEYTGKPFAFFADPDALPIELYEM